MIQGMTFGYAEHGHLAGVPSLIVTVGERPDEDTRPVTLDQLCIVAESRRNLLVYVYLRDTSMATAKMVAEIHYRLKRRGIYCAACVPPGTYLPVDRLAYDSVMRVTDVDIHDLDDIDSRIGSVSVHTWPGSRVMQHLDALPAEHGKFLILSGEDLGQAKVWLNGTQSSSWRLLPSHPLNDLEAAELYVMAAS